MTARDQKTSERKIASLFRTKKKKMYRKPIFAKTSIIRTESTEGETIEMKMDRIVNQREPLTDGAPLIYTDLNDGVNPIYDVRTDKMEQALMAKDKPTRNELAKRKQYLEEIKQKEEGETPVDSGTAD